jgi:hypothetical protein
MQLPSRPSVSAESCCEGGAISAACAPCTLAALPSPVLTSPTATKAAPSAAAAITAPAAASSTSTLLVGGAASSSPSSRVASLRAS